MRASKLLHYRRRDSKLAFVAKEDAARALLASRRQAAASSSGHKVLRPA